MPFGSFGLPDIGGLPENGGRASRGRLVARAPIAATLLAVVACALGLPACSKKLSSSGGTMDTLFYDVLGMDRDTSYYYDTLYNAHERNTFCYRCTDDPYLADKCIDAIVHLGKASYNRLEGEVQVILLLSDVAIEDPSALARATAAGALTLLGSRLPVAPAPEVAERGDTYLKLIKEMDSFHDADGRLKQDTPMIRRRELQIINEIASFKFPNLQLTKDGLRFFAQAKYVSLETDPTLRDAYDRAMVRRSRALVFATLEGAVVDGNHNVRLDAIKGLKILRDAGALDIVLERLAIESHPFVRSEMAEYLGVIGGKKAATALVELLRDDDGGVRLRARRALTRISGTDLGKEPGPWEAWLETATFPAPGATPPSEGPAVCPPPVPFPPAPFSPSAVPPPGSIPPPPPMPPPPNAPRPGGQAPVPDPRPIPPPPPLPPEPAPPQNPGPEPAPQANAR